MASHKILDNEKRLSQNTGFTLIEVLVVITIILILGGMTMTTSFETFRGTSSRSERDRMLSALYRARSQSISNICLGTACTGGKPHGVHFENGKYTIFQGTSYETRDIEYDEIITNSYPTNISSGSITDVVFSQLSGDVSTNPTGVWTITISDDISHNSIITLNAEGRIAWTN